MSIAFCRAVQTTNPSFDRAKFKQVDLKYQIRYNSIINNIVKELKNVNNLNQMRHLS